MSLQLPTGKDSLASLIRMQLQTLSPFADSSFVSREILCQLLRNVVISFYHNETSCQINSSTPTQTHLHAQKHSPSPPSCVPEWRHSLKTYFSETAQRPRRLFYRKHVATHCYHASKEGLTGQDGWLRLITLQPPRFYLWTSLSNWPRQTSYR